MSDQRPFMIEASHYDTERLLEMWRWLVPRTESPFLLSCMGDWVFGRPDGLHQQRIRCRHCKAEWTVAWEYCPECKRNYGGAVYPAKQTLAELADINTIVAKIHVAFAGVQLDDGTTIHEADLEGAYDEEGIVLAARAKDAETDWREVPAWKIERFPAALSFLDAKGWRFYIPAYMCWTLKNWRTSSSLTVDSVIWNFEHSSDDRYATLSSEQGASVFAFLDFFRRYSGLPEPQRAIEAYWHRFKTAGSPTSD